MLVTPVVLCPLFPTLPFSSSIFAYYLVGTNALLLPNVLSLSDTYMALSQKIPSYFKSLIDRGFPSLWVLSHPTMNTVFPLV